MSEPKVERLIISKDGVARGIHGPLVDKITNALGKPEIMRASHVEPGSELSLAALEWLYSARSPYVTWPLEMQPEGRTLWWAAMQPISPTGPVLGPFRTRDEALKEEVAWLQAHNVPICGPCRHGT